MSAKIPAWFRDQLLTSPIDKLDDDFDPKQTIAALENELDQTIQALEQRSPNYNQQATYAESLVKILNRHLGWSAITHSILGATYTGLGFDYDPLEITVYNPQIPYTTEERLAILQTLQQQLVADHSSTLRQDALVSYIELKHPDNQAIVCHITIQNDMAITVCQLLNRYCDITPIFPSLVLIVRYWAQYKNIQSPTQGTLSSFAYILLVLFFLQHQKILPVLQHSQLMKELGFTLDKYFVDRYDCSFCDDILISAAWKTKLLNLGTNPTNQQDKSTETNEETEATRSDNSHPSLLTLLYRFFIVSSMLTRLMIYLMYFLVSSS